MTEKYRCKCTLCWPVAPTYAPQKPQKCGNKKAAEVGSLFSFY